MKTLHNLIMARWQEDFGSIHNEQPMDAYTVSGFVRSILMDNEGEVQFREPSSPTVKESGGQEEIMKALEEARCLDPESENWSYHAASRIALEAIKKTRKPLDR